MRYISGDLFLGLKNVEDIYLNYLQIVTFDATLFHGLPKLKNVVLNDNQIEIVPKNAFDLSNFSSQAKVYLTRNPLKEESITYLKGQLGSRFNF